MIQALTIRIPQTRHRVIRQWIIAAATIASTLLTTFAVGQTNAPASQETWYQVELILFRQGGNPKDHVERWPNDIKLTYPLDWQVLTNEVPVTDEPAQENPETAPAATQQAIEPAGADPLSRVPASRKLYLLPDTDLALNDQARRIQRSNRYRLLFHGGWRQGMVEYGEEPSIIISVGEASGDHRELEGSINLKLQRYLHITTDLWLTDFATNFGQERERWPELPLPPYFPRAATQTPADSSDISSGVSAGNSGSNSSGNSNYWTQFQVSSPDYVSQIDQPYIIENIATVQQTRRMRSAELHYIDHPLVGILIQFTPIDPPRVGDNAMISGAGAPAN